MVDAPDIMPTLLGLCDIPAPESVEGVDFSGYLSGDPDPTDGAALLSCPQPFGQWTRAKHGGMEYRGVRTRRYTYVRDLQRPWLLYDNQTDPYQLLNLVNDPERAGIKLELEAILERKLRERGDEFLPGDSYIQTWGYEVDEYGTVPYRW